MSNRYNYAWVTITGKVFVSEDELCDALGLKYIENGDEEISPAEQLIDVHPERIRVAFQDLANDKIHDLFPTDEPVKLTDVEIDMDTFR